MTIAKCKAYVDLNLLPSSPPTLVYYHPQSLRIYLREQMEINGKHDNRSYTKGVWIICMRSMNMSLRCSEIAYNRWYYDPWHFAENL